MIDSFSIDTPAVAWIFAALVVVGAVLALRGRLAGPIMVGVLCVIEVAFVPAYSRSSAFDWIVQGLVVVFGATGIVAVTASLLERRRHLARVA